MPSDGPVIGICAVRERARWSFWDQTAHLVSDSYVSAVQRTGAVALLIPVDERAPLAPLSRIDALMLIGGADLDPAAYGEETDPDTEATYRERDDFELAMLRGALDYRMPVLAICRGMQILNVACGGTLIQNLPEPGGVNPHRRALGTFEGTEHTVTLEPGSLAAEAAGEEVHTVRCHHHQGVDRVGDGLVVTGRAVVDGLPEAIELEEGGWVLGVQWHPEADERTRLFAALTAAAEQWSKGPQLTPAARSGIPSPDTDPPHGG